MSHTPTGPDDVAAPAADTRLFRSSPAWMCFVLLVTGTPAATAVVLLLHVLDGEGMGWRQLGEAGMDALLYSAVFAAVGAGHLWRTQTWVRISSGGIELAAHGGDPVLLDWPEIVSARVRRRGPRAVLDVVPVDVDAVRSVAPGRNLPRMRDTADGTAFTIDVGLLRPGPAALRAALIRRDPDNHPGDCS